MSPTALLMVGLLFGTIISLGTAANFTPGVTFNRNVCYNLTLDLISNGTLLPDDEVFFRDDAGNPMFHADNLTLTLPGCRKVCGPKYGWYTDIGPRLSVWLIPIFLLITNIDLSPLDKRRFLAIFHFLGDPIDSFWSLIHKIDAWDHCYSMAEKYHVNACERRKRVIATVLAGVEEVKRSEEHTSELQSHSDLVCRLLL